MADTIGLRAAAKQLGMKHSTLLTKVRKRSDRPNHCPEWKDAPGLVWNDDRVSFTEEFIGWARWKTVGSTPHERVTYTPDLPRETSIDESNTAKVLTSKSEDIRSLDDALKFFAVDLAIWRVDHFTVNSWQMGYKTQEGEAESKTLYQVKVVLVRIVSMAVEEGIAKFIEHIAEISPVRSPRDYIIVDADPHLLEVSLFDHHFGQLSWAREAGSNYDIKIAAAIYQHAIEDILLKTTNFDIEEILLPIGNDFLNTDNLESTTSHGTPQDSDGRFARIVEASTMAVIQGIDELARVAPVNVVLVAGNHDTVSAWHVARFLWAYYRNDPNITVDIEPMARKYVQYGVSLIGFTHGNEEPHKSLPVIMATEQSRAWADTLHHCWHIGHFHKAKETLFTSVDTIDGVEVRILPSLSANSAWAFHKGYLPTRTAEAHLFSKTNGPTGYFVTRAK